MQGGGLRWETEEDLPQHIIVDRQGGRHRRRGDAAASVAGHSGSLLTCLDLGMKARTAAAGDSVSLLTRLDWMMEARATARGHSGVLLAGVDLGMEARAAAAGSFGPVRS